MNNKPVFPFSQGQVFENLVYRTCDGDNYYRKEFIKDVLNLRSSKYFFVEDGVDSLTICDRPYIDYSAQKKRFRPTLLGYPINQKVSDKLFDKTKPAGHWFSHYDRKIMELLTTVPVIPFCVTKNIKSFSGSGNIFPRGNYFSIGTFEGLPSPSNDGSLPINPLSTRTPFFAAVEVAEKHSKMFEVFDARWTVDRFSVQNVFIPVKAFSTPEQIGLVLLPNGSVTWLWHEGQWKTCRVSTTFCEKGKNSFQCKFIELDLNENHVLQEKPCLLEISGKEIEVHKKIAKLLEEDDLRIAFRSMFKMEANTKIIPPRSQLVSMIAKNFNSEFLDPYKMNLLKSTAYKTMSSFSEFALALAQKSPPLSATIMDKAHSDWLCEFAVIAARDKTPLFWGIDSMLNNKWSAYIRAALIAAGFSPNASGQSAHAYSLYQFGVESKDIKDNLMKQVDVSFSATVERLVFETFKVTPNEKQIIAVPNFVIKKGENAVKQYVANCFNESIQDYQLRNYTTIGEKTYRANRGAETKTRVDLTTIKVNEIVHP
jgi:hypothetical protein